MRRFWLWAASTLGVLAASIALVAFYKYWQSWAAYETGSRNSSGTPPNYNYWSGFGSVFPWGMGALVILARLTYQHAKATNCHTHGCWRIGSLPVGQYKTCRKHHAESTGAKVDIEHLKVHHRLANRKRLRDAGYNTNEET